jgi:excisionase family DNA binding protein
MLLEATQFPQVMTLKEAAASLKVPLPTLHKLISTDQLISYRIGRRRYITGKAALDFILSRHSPREVAA